MAVCRLSLHLSSSEGRKTLENKYIFQIGTLNPHGIDHRFLFNNLFLNRVREMVNFELGKGVEKYGFFSSCRVRGTQKKHLSLYLYRAKTLSSLLFC